MSWVYETVSELIDKGYRPIPHGDLSPLAGFKNGERYPVSHELWKKSKWVSLALDESLLIDYDGNKGEVISLEELADQLEMDYETLLSSQVQKNRKGDSLHFLFHRNEPMTNLRHSKDGWVERVDIKTGNQLMHIKPHKTLELPNISLLPAAPKVAVNALRSKPSPLPLVEKLGVFDDWLVNLSNDASIHGSTLSLSAHMLSKGLGREFVIKAIQMMIDGRLLRSGLSPQEKERLRARREDIPRLVQGAIDKGFHNPSRRVFTDYGLFEKGWLSRSIPEPKILIDDLLPSNVFGFVGSGGAAKTTLMLKIMIHVILDKDIWGRRINHAGKCLFISAEDDLQVMQHRVQKICKSMFLTPTEEETIERSLYIHDISGEMLRFVEADKNSNFTITQHVDDLIELYKDKGIELACFDPAVFFGPGERYINDGDAALMQCARRISTGLGGAATGYIHHMSKEATAHKDITAHAGRGGSAFGDNARCIWVLHKYSNSADDQKKFPGVPDQISDFDVLDGRVGVLKVAKFSFGKHVSDFFWMKRGYVNGFDIEFLKSASCSSGELSEKQKSREENLQKEYMRELLKEIKSAQEGDKAHNKTSIRSKAILVNGKRLAKGSIESLLGEMERLGYIRTDSYSGDKRKKMLIPSGLAIPDDELIEEEVAEN